MNQAQLIRTETSNQGTFGVLLAGGFRCYTLEPPWRDNRPSISCIPPGEYDVEPWNSRKFPHTFHLRNVEGRSAILTHTGNLAGDKSKGYRTHSLGCVLVGLKIGYLERQKAILLSSVAMNRLREIAPPGSWRLSIVGGV